MLAKTDAIRFFTGALAAVFLWSAVPMPAAQAGVVGTEAAVTQAEHEAVKERLNELLARDEIRQGLMANGVDPAEAQARVASLTPGEAQKIAGKLEELPAGGNSLVGAIVFIFVLLLVTDLLGLTDFYPFTR